MHAATVNEAAKILAEGIAQRPSDIDVVLVNGYGYPAWRGGPMHEADRIGLPVVLERVARMYEADGPGWEPAPLLQEMVAAGKRFADLNGYSDSPHTSGHSGCAGAPSASRIFRRAAAVPTSPSPSHIER
ncbi:3-hydroxyacyl-CoA dehydrogenase family protein [Rhodovastum sp. RN2-1]|uniref:3-hydroxyacyl-CoA dehydrogenase family protein n=1 Tax=Limobrevibacterium gyesilva TaxID=2991712 RepID=A0AA41YLZ9_9PROT|nr:3-hydroxyacyl-CoA dehydrogenase family protein [Limobrevibacterium gyesilva]